jgi:signal transduction histidine kinase
MLEAVFEPFVQVDMGLTREHAGTGLGLAISREFARAMGGDLSAVSVLGQGSTFSLRLPKAPEEVAPAELAAHVGTAAAQPAT